LILRKIIKIVATRSCILKLQFIKFNFGWSSATDPAGVAHSASPGFLPGFLKGPASKWRDRRKRGKDWSREKRGKEERKKDKKRKKEGKEKGRETRPTNWHFTPLAKS